MKKLFGLLIILLITLSFTGAGSLEVVDWTDPSAGNPSITVSGSFKAKNTGTTDLNGITFVKSDLIGIGDPTKQISLNEIGFSPLSIATLTAGSTSSAITMTVNIPQGLTPDTYQGNVEVKDNSVETTTHILSVVVNAYPKLEIQTYSDTTPLILIGEDGETITSSFTLKNTGNVDLTSLDISFTGTLTDSSGKTITLKFNNGNPLPVLVAGSSLTVPIKAELESGLDLDVYSGIIEIKDNLQTTANANFKLEIKVRPKICEDGIRSDGLPGGNNLKVKIKDPDSGDDFHPGDEIEVTVEVENNDNSDLDVIVEATLYNLNQNDELDNVESDAEEIEDGKSKKFTVKLTVPKEKIDEDDDFVIFVKAYEDGGEDENCGEEELRIDIKKETHRIVIDNVLFTPSTVKCGDSFDATINIKNVGKRNEDDIIVKLVDDELGIDLSEGPFDLGKEGKDDDEKTIRFKDIKVPKGLDEKEYSIEVLVEYGSYEESSFETITLKQCSADDISEEAELSVLISNFNLDIGDGFSIPVTVINNGEDGQFLISVSNTGSWADTVLPQTLDLDSEKSETIYFNLKSKEDLNEGKYTAIVDLRKGSTILDTKTVTVDLKKKKSLVSSTGSNITSLFSDSNKLFWILGDIILVIIAIFFIKLIFSGGKKQIKEVKF